MKRLLLAFALLFTIPFNASCVKEIPIEVVVSGSHCNWKKPVENAILAHTYKIKIEPDPNYELYLGSEVEEKVEGIVVKKPGGLDITGLLGPEDYNEETYILTIPGRFVSEKLIIIAEAQEGPGPE